MSLSKQEIIELRFNRIIIFFYCLLIISLPVSIALVESMAGFVIFFFVIKKTLIYAEQIKGQNLKLAFRMLMSCFYPKDQFLNKPIGLYFFSVLISVIFSQYLEISIIAFIAKLLEGYFLYYSFVDCIKTRQHLRICISIYVITVLILVLDGVFQYIFKVDFLRQLPISDNRVLATLRHANDFGAYIIIFIPLILGLLILPYQKEGSFIQLCKEAKFGPDLISKIVLFITLVLMLVCLGLTFSRGSWVGFWCSMIFFVLLLRKYFIITFLISIVFLSVFLPLMMKYRDVSFTTDSVQLVREYGKIDPTLENLNKLSELDRQRVELVHHGQLGMGRFGFWEQAISIIEKYPVFGSGLNTYAKQTKYYAHNCYLQMTAETGIVGLIAFLSMIWILFWRSIQKFFSLKDVFLRNVLAGALAGFGGFLIQSFFDTTLYSVQLGNLMWIFMGLVIAIPRVAGSVE
jgi:O-antigen ligase